MSKALVKNIQYAKRDSSTLTAILNLHRKDARTLGFMPREAFKEAITDKRVLVYLDDGQLKGYLFFGRNYRSELIYITHLCIGAEFRGQGIARALIEFLEEETKRTYRGIRVRCRRDFAAERMWSHLGFVYRGEREGRGREKRSLSILWKDFGHPDLFNSLPIDEECIQVAIDMNILIDLISEKNPKNGSLDVITEHVGIELCVTPEIYNEIGRNEDREKREFLIGIASTFREIRQDTNISAETCEPIAELYPNEMSEQDHSDLQHIKYCIQSNTSIFLSNDEALINRFSKSTLTGKLSVLRPWELIAHIDVIQDGLKYKPSLLSGTDLHIRDVKVEDIDLITECFKNPNEKKSKYRNRLSSFFSNIGQFRIQIIEDEGLPIALLVEEQIESNSTLAVPVVEIAKSKIQNILCRHILKSFIERTLKKGLAITKISDSAFVGIFENEAYTLGFYRAEDTLIKLSPKGLLTTSQFSSIPQAYSKHLTKYPKMLDDLNKLCIRIAANPTKREIEVAERTLWPMKIEGIGTSYYLVPIKPDWALNLFDSELANRTIFGAEKELILQTENVYYSMSRVKLITPARILWYVSRWGNSSDGTMAIRAVSKLEKYDRGKAKEIFKRYHRLGVYRWEDIMSMTGSKPLVGISAYVFSQTELLPNPIPLTTLKELWRDHMEKELIPQSTMKIPEELFKIVYRKGANAL